MSLIGGSIDKKLNADNRQNVGSSVTMGATLNTRTAPYSTSEVINTYLRSQLTETELDYIFNNRKLFKFTLLVGDRRNMLPQRVARVNNWVGGDVTNLLLTPEPFTDAYKFRLTFNRKELKITDSHFGENTYGGLRGLYIEKI